jgi:ABC-type transport system substrate-binding protein
MMLLVMASPVAAQSPSTSPNPSGATPQTLTYALDGDFLYLTNSASDVPTANATQWIYDALYEYTPELTVAPDLATAPATISKDGLTWTLKLNQNVKFMPTGTPLTADDVVWTYDLANSPNCPFNPSLCLGGIQVDRGDGTLVPVIKSIKKVDDYTVQFVLNAKYAPFATLILPGIAIDSKAADLASYAKIAGAVTADEVKAVNDPVQAELANPTGPPAPAASPEAGATAGPTNPPTPNVAQFQQQMEALLTKAGISLPNQDDYQLTDANGNPTGLDTEAYAEAEAALVLQLNNSLTASSDADRVAQSYTLLDIQRNPVGTGPYYVASPDDVQPGQQLTLTANPDYFGGAPKLANIYLPIIKDSVAAGAALKSGQIDWQYQMTADALAQVQGADNVKIGSWPDFGWFGLFFNLRPGALFSDLNLRKAAALCFDKDATVQQATSGNSTPIDGDIPPASWAYNPNVTKYPFDADKGNQLIQASGWKKNANGVYEKNGQEFGDIVPVRAGKPDRIEFMQLWASAMNQNCGGNFTVKETDFTTLLSMIQNWPLTNPYTNKPFNLYFGGFSTSYDPDPYSLFHSSQCLTKDSAQGPAAPYNFECWKDPAADKLILKGLATYDQAARTKVYQNFEQEISDQLPVLFAWADIRSDGVASTVNGEQEWTPSNMDGPTWFVPLQDITNDKTEAQ